MQILNELSDESNVIGSFVGIVPNLVDIHTISNTCCFAARFEVIREAVVYCKGNANACVGGARSMDHVAL